jgi:N-acetylglucosamine-6-phosphate deacetylase
MLASAVKSIDLGYARELVAAGGGKVKRVTFAPEIEGATRLVEFLCENGISPSMGHSLANEEETLRAIEAGARCCTHLFNGMPKLAQREMNLTSVALTDPRVMVELITDGRHLHPRIVYLACRCKADFKVAAISDATMAAGMPSGNYRIGPTVITVDDGFSRSTDGVLAGTTTLLDDGWHSLMSYSHTSETYAASAVSQNSALQLGLTDRGKLLPGLRADMAFFECGTNRPLLTVRRGEIVFAAEGAFTNE